MTMYSTVSVPSTIDATPIAVYAWEPPQNPRGAVQISHGVAEHGPRYDRLAAALTAAGYAVYAHDHRGHGSSISDQVTLGGFGAAGWSGLVADLVALGDRIHGEQLGRPLFLLGHSMGSFALQEAILDRSDLYAGAVLSGIDGPRRLHRRPGRGRRRQRRPHGVQRRLRAPHGVRVAEPRRGRGRQVRRRPALRVRPGPGDHSGPVRVGGPARRPRGARRHPLRSANPPRLRRRRPTRRRRSARRAPRAALPGRRCHRRDRRAVTPAPGTRSSTRPTATRSRRT